MHTSYGRHKWVRLAYEIMSAPEEFQIRLKTALEVLEGIICLADDILVYGRKRLCGSSKRPQKKIHSSDELL